MFYSELLRLIIQFSSVADLASVKKKVSAKSEQCYYYELIIIKVMLNAIK